LSGSRIGGFLYIPGIVKLRESPGRAGGLPRSNYKKFVARHGIHVAELDAAPVELLQNKLRTAIVSCLDMDLFRREQDQEREDAAFIAARKKIIIEAIKEG